MWKGVGVCESETHTKTYSEETKQRREPRTLKSKFVFFSVLYQSYCDRNKLP